MDMLLPLAVFAFVSSITPGPNNAMLSASGITFGFRRTIPHLFGVWVGFATLLAVCGSGLGALLERVPALVIVMRVVGSAYLLYLAWLMRKAFEPRETTSVGRPLRFHEAAAFQFINPKAWVMAITAVSVFGQSMEPFWLALAAICVVFSVVNLPCICSWAALGASIRPWLNSARRRSALGAVVAVLMVYSVVIMWI